MVFSGCFLDWNIVFCVNTRRPNCLSKYLCSAHILSFLLLSYQVSTKLLPAEIYLLQSWAKSNCLSIIIVKIVLIIIITIIIIVSKRSVTAGLMHERKCAWYPMYSSLLRHSCIPSCFIISSKESFSLDDIWWWRGGCGGWSMQICPLTFAKITKQHERNLSIKGKSTCAFITFMAYIWFGGARSQNTAMWLYYSLQRNKYI